MRELRSSAIKDIDGNEVEFWFYSLRTVAQHLEIEKLNHQHGSTQASLLLSVFVVCALDADGKRLFSSVDFKEVANKYLYDDLVAACLAMGGVTPESPDPKA